MTTEEKPTSPKAWHFPWAIDRRKLGRAAVGGALLSAGALGYWFLVKPLLRLPRLPLTPWGSSFPMELDLEAAAPPGAMLVFGFKDLSVQFESLRSSELYRYFDERQTAAAKRARAAFKVSRPVPKIDGLEVLGRLLGRSALLAVYPDHMDGRPQKAGADREAALFLTRLPPDFKWDDIPGLGPQIAALPAERRDGFTLRQVNAAFMAQGRQGPSEILIVSDDLALVRAAVKAAGGREGETSLAREAWAESAMASIRPGAFAYALVDFKKILTASKLGGLAASLPDWGSTYFEWTGGLAGGGFSHAPNGMTGEGILSPKTGPGPHPILDLTPEDGWLTFASNSLDLKSVMKLRGTAEDARLPMPLKGLMGEQKLNPVLKAQIEFGEFLKKLLADRDIGPLQEIIGEQVAVSVVGFGEDTTQLSAVIQLKSPLKARLALKKGLEALARTDGMGSPVAKVIPGVGKSFSLAIDSKGKDPTLLLVSRQGQWLVFATGEEALSKTADKIRAGKTYELPDALKEPANMVLLFDPPAFYRNINEAMRAAKERGTTIADFDNDSWAFSEILNAFGRGGFSVANHTDGASTRFFLPFKDPGKETWARALAHVARAMEEKALQELGAEIQMTLARAQLTYEAGITQYAKERGRLPRDRSLLIPYLQQILPADPFTGSQRVVQAYDGRGGWVFDAKHSRVAANHETKAFDDWALRELLAKFRVSLQRYKTLHQSFPPHLKALATFERVAEIPGNTVPVHHRPSNAAHYFRDSGDVGPSDTGGWGYLNNPSSSDFGNIFVNCTHTDSAGRSWDSY